jgi:hypothetical protein
MAWSAVGKVGKADFWLAIEFVHQKKDLCFHQADSMTCALGDRRLYLQREHNGARRQRATSES